MTIEEFKSGLQEKDNVKLMELYTLFKSDNKEIDAKLSAIKEEFAERLHEKQVNNLIINVNGIDWKTGYQSSTRKNVNYTLLQEIVGNHKYEEIVEKKTSTFLVIKKAPKKTTKKTRRKPVTDKMHTPPIGNLA